VVHLLSFQQAEIQNVREHKLEPILPGKVGYLTALPQVKRLLREIRPDILHAHYATSFGLLGALSGFHPYVISVWGSDVFAFPGKSLIHKRLLEFNLSRADHICSTSQVLASEVKKYTTRAVTVTPFGIDCQVFRPLSPRDRNADEFVVGTVKGLDPVYGIQHLLRGFALLVQRHPQKRLRLVIAGEGRLKDHLVKLAEELGIANATQFLGFVPHHQVPELLNTFSVFVVASEWESFGVAALEASACGVPVVVSNVGGLVEVVRDGVTGLLVPPRNPEAIAASLSKLISDEQLRHEMGTAGREFVLKNYEWNETAGRMEQLYQSLLQGGRRVC
jgi:glycosyltransferase involved in cell wall biosynthesis